MIEEVTEKILSESAWLGNEIAKLAQLCEIEFPARERLRKLTETLAETVFRENENCLPINNEDDAEFLKNSCGNGIVAENAEATCPLVFDCATVPARPMLYFRRQYVEEIFIARKISELAASTGTLVGEELEKIICAGEESGFPFALNKEQRNAVRKMIERQFVVVSGGPGTGKTTMLVRALICLQKQNPSARILIAAPTGKAAARIRESITQQTQGATMQAETLTSLVRDLPTQTLHRLLGISRWNQNPGKEIAADIVIVDEASMISQTLMASLLKSLPRDTKLVLLGDKNQLDSVDAGHVLGDFCATGTLASSRVELTESRRFSDKKFLGKLSRYVLAGDLASTRKALASAPNSASVYILGDDESPCGKIIAALTETLPQILKNPPNDAEPATLLAALERSRVLTSMRAGPLGVDSLNEIARKIFAPKSAGEIFHGQPILITRNSDLQDLRNGDVGIILRSSDSDKFYAWFSDSDGIRRVPVAFLPEFETAYAMTIHKSQGSEFSRLCVILPPTNVSNFYTRQLLYTAITRFKETDDSHFSFLYSSASLNTCIRNVTSSHSLLRERIETEFQKSR